MATRKLIAARDMGSSISLVVIRKVQFASVRNRHIQFYDVTRPR